MRLRLIDMCSATEVVWYFNSYCGSYSPYFSIRKKLVMVMSCTSHISIYKRVRKSLINIIRPFCSPLLDTVSPIYGTFCSMAIVNYPNSVILHFKRTIWWTFNYAGFLFLSFILPKCHRLCSNNIAKSVLKNHNSVFDKNNREQPLGLILLRYMKLHCVMFEVTLQYRNAYRHVVYLQAQ